MQTTSVKQGWSCPRGLSRRRTTNQGSAGGASRTQFWWQHRAASCWEEQFLTTLWPTFTNAQKALLRSQRGPLASEALTVSPTSRATRMEPQPFRLWLCRRLFLFSFCTCWCGRRLGVYGHHCAACSRAGVFGRVRGSSSVQRSLDVGEFNQLDGRIADGRPLWHGAQLAIDTTMTAGRARLVVFVVEVGGRWSQEASIFLRDLAKAQAQAAPLILQGRVQAVYLRRWSSLLVCSLVESFCSLFVGETACARHRRDVPPLDVVLRDAIQ